MVHNWDDQLKHLLHEITLHYEASYKDDQWFHEILCLLHIASNKCSKVKYKLYVLSVVYIRKSSTVYDKTFEGENFRGFRGF